MSLVPVTKKPHVRVPSAAVLEKYQTDMQRRAPPLAPATRATIDARQNVLARIGYGTTNLQEAPDKVKELDKAVTLTATKPKLLQAIKWGRLFGGAGAIIIIKGHEKKLDTPLDLDDVGLDSYRGLLVFDRWSGITPSATINT